MSKLFYRTAKSARRHRVVASLLGVLAVFGTAAAVYAAPSSDFTFTAQPTSQTINSGSSASYVVSVTPNGAFGGKLTFSTGNLPKGMSATFSPTSVTVPAGSTATQTATVTISGGQPTAGTYSPTVTASGSVSHTISLSLTVVNQNAANFSLSLNPSNLTPVAGPSNPTSTVTITRTNWTGAVTLGPVKGPLAGGALPAGVSATFTTASGPTTLTTTGSSATLVIATTPWTTPPGVYTLVLPGSAVLSGKSSTTNYAAFTLTVPQPGNFTISGNLASPLTLGLGGTQSLNLSITNPYSTPLTLNNIVVAPPSVTQSEASMAKGTCNQSGTNSPNFTITNLARNYSVTVPVGGPAMKLSQLGSGLTPTVTWIDQPLFAQNGCLGATLHFTYSATGQY
jgi:hypothetical protein